MITSVRFLMGIITKTEVNTVWPNVDINTTQEMVFGARVIKSITHELTEVTENLRKTEGSAFRTYTNALSPPSF